MLCGLPPNVQKHASRLYNGQDRGCVECDIYKNFNECIKFEFDNKSLLYLNDEKIILIEECLTFL